MFTVVQRRRKPYTVASLGRGPVSAAIQPVHYRPPVWLQIGYISVPRTVEFVYFGRVVRGVVGREGTHADRKAYDVQTSHICLADSRKQVGRYIFLTDRRSRRSLHLSTNAYTRSVIRWLGIEPHIGKRRSPHESHLERMHWVVERAINWIKGLRRMRVRYDRSQITIDAWTSIAAAVAC